MAVGPSGGEGIGGVPLPSSFIGMTKMPSETPSGVEGIGGVVGDDGEQPRPGERERLRSPNSSGHAMDMNSSTDDIASRIATADDASARRAEPNVPGCLRLS